VFARRSLVALLLVIGLAGCGPKTDGAETTPAGTVRAAFELLARHDVRTAALLGCPERREPGRPPMIVEGLMYLTAPVPMPEFEETLALLDIDLSDVRVEEVPSFGQAALFVPVTGVLRVSADPDEIEAAVRATAALQGEAVDEAVLRETLDVIRSGPLEIDLGQAMEPVRVVAVGDRWLICEQAPSPAPAAPSDA
jgi:hypothetical protein